MANRSTPEDPIGQIQETTKFLRSKINVVPQIAIIGGSGFKDVGTHMEELVAVDYSDIPHFIGCSVPGHAGQLMFGKLGGASVVFMKGRIHLYEGYSIWQSTFAIRVLAELGIKVLIVTNASGGINDKYKAGDVMIIKDHINLPGLGGLNPCYGLNDDRLGPRFTPLNAAYDRKFRSAAWRVIRRLNLSHLAHEGIYLSQLGPCYETPAELRMMRTMGADAVGMSTCAEVAVARQCGVRCFGLSLISNECVVNDEEDETEDEGGVGSKTTVVGGESAPVVGDTGPNHNEVLDVGTKSAQTVYSIISGVIAEIVPLI